LVYTYFEIGRMILEDEQQGKERAEYGKQLIKGLSHRLKKKFGKGFFERNLEQMRQFYLVYSIPQTVSAESQVAQSQAMSRKSDENAIWQTASAKSQIPLFKLGWSHYLILMRMDDISERNFYEIESIQNNWKVRELKRNFDSAL